MIVFCIVLLFCFHLNNRIEVSSVEHCSQAFYFNVFTPNECSDWIQLTEKRGYTPALVNVGMREVLMSNLGNNDRCIMEASCMAQVLFEHIESYLPKRWNNYQLVGLNERLRFLRYDPGQKFEKHMGKRYLLCVCRWSFQCFSVDGVYCRSDGSGEQSFIVSGVVLYTYRWSILS